MSMRYSRVGVLAGDKLPGGDRSAVRYIYALLT